MKSLFVVHSGGLSRYQVPDAEPDPGAYKRSAVGFLAKGKHQKSGYDGSSMGFGRSGGAGSGMYSGNAMGFKKAA